jgi:transposase
MQVKEPLAPNAIQIYAGIDVCKDWLDIYLHPLGEKLRVPNSAAGLKKLKALLASHGRSLTIMEATAKLHRLAHRNLHDSGFAVALINPARSRYFANAIGTRAKTDAIDARMLALYGQMLDPHVIEPCPQAIEEMQELFRGRQTAMATRTSMINQERAATTTFLKAELKRQIKVLDSSIAKLDAEIAARIKADPAIAHRYDIILSIPSVGEVAAIGMLLGLSEMGSCSNKKIALLAGLAPIAKDSGDSSGQRHIAGGRDQVRSAIYMAAMNAARFNPDMKIVYDRLIAAGKRGKVALTAIMRKLVVLANTLITENRKWTPQKP